MPNVSAPSPSLEILFFLSPQNRIRRKFRRLRKESGGCHARPPAGLRSSLPFVYHLLILPQGSGPPGPGPCHHNGLGLRKKLPRERSPGCSARITDFRGWPSSINQSPVRFVSRSTMRESCPEEVKGGGAVASLRAWSRELPGLLASPALAFDSFLSFWDGTSGNQRSIHNSFPIGAGLK